MHFLCHLNCPGFGDGDGNITSNFRGPEPLLRLNRQFGDFSSPQLVVFG